METTSTNIIQLIIAWVIIIGAVGFTIRGIWKAFTKKKDCSGCSDCSLHDSCTKPEKGENETRGTQSNT